MILINDNIEGIDLQESMGLLSEQRRDKVLAIKDIMAQKASVAAYILLCEGLRQEYGITGSPVFTYNSHGKPSLEGRSDIHFNFSHCKTAAICAVDNVEVGIDIETIRAYNRRLAQYTMNDDEFKRIESSPNPDIEFTRLWTMKEAVAKLSGTGLNDIKNLLTNFTGEIETVVDTDKGYIYSFCRKKEV